MMAVVRNEVGLNAVKEQLGNDLVFSEFIQHNTAVHKMYVIGDTFAYKCSQSCSISNM